MPAKELQYPHQIDDWLCDWGSRLEDSAEMILIGSGALLWHVFQAGLDVPLPEKSMDVDPITFDESVAELAYESIIGSEFEQEHGWHVNLMPDFALKGLPEGWRERAVSATYEKLLVIVPAISDLLVPKLSRGEPRDLAHRDYLVELGLWIESGK